ncbi:hypothetical protein J6590_082781 [Homalodisca vitripennis]|nr:hypothetical protein J6590_082781 [Homalodisca vitripennis]
MENVRKRGATIHSREREVIIRVIEICKVLTVPLAKATERAANYCKVSKQSIKSIRKEAKSTPAEKLMSPDEWCDHVQHIEQEYWEKDGITEDAIDEFVIRLGEDDDDSSSSDSSDDPSDPESDEKLAVPLPMDSDTSTENKMFSK